jgi:hypothetical protein
VAGRPSLGRPRSFLEDRLRSRAISSASTSLWTHLRDRPGRLFRPLRRIRRRTNLRIHRDGRVFVADHKRGLLTVDPTTLPRFSSTMPTANFDRAERSALTPSGGVYHRHGPFGPAHPGVAG